MTYSCFRQMPADKLKNTVKLDYSGYLTNKFNFDKCLVCSLMTIQEYHLIVDEFCQYFNSFSGNEETQQLWIKSHLFAQRKQFRECRLSSLVSGLYLSWIVLREWKRNRRTIEINDYAHFSQGLILHFYYVKFIWIFLALHNAILQGLLFRVPCWVCYSEV